MIQPCDFFFFAFAIDCLCYLVEQVGQHGRFRNLKEQTDRMKDNVLKHLRRTKMPSALNDKAIHSAKQAGAQLFADMDPLLRKDKLEEMVSRTMGIGLVQLILEITKNIYFNILSILSKMSWCNINVINI